MTNWTLESSLSPGSCLDYLDVEGPGGHEKGVHLLAEHNHPLVKVDSRESERYFPSWADPVKRYLV